MFSFENLIKENYKEHMKPYFKRKQDFMDSIQSFNDIDDEKIIEIIDYFGYEGFNNEEDAFEDLKQKIELYKSLPEKIKLYRAVGLNHINDFKKSEIGEHFVLDEWRIDSDLLMSIGYENWDEYVEPYVVEVETDKSNIDIWQTIIQNLSFPNESEINLKDKGRKTKVLNIKPLF